MAKQFDNARQVPVQSLGVGERVIVGGRAAEIVDMGGKVLRFIADLSISLRRPDDGRGYTHAGTGGLKRGVQYEEHTLQD
jgi:hypothetical protein